MRSLAAMWVVAFALAGCRGYEAHGSRLEPATPAADFTLDDAAGGPFTLTDQRGKVVVLYFGFTSCPDICPTTLADLSAALEQLGAAKGDVEVAMITVDPARDTPDRLRDFVAGFDPDFHGLTGTPEELAAVYDAYNVTVQRQELPQSALGYTVDHSASLFVIDQEGRLVEMFLHGTPPQHMAEDLGHLVDEGV